MTDQPHTERRNWRLADGAEVPEVLVRTSLLNLGLFLQEYGPIGAYDALALTRGEQPVRTPLGNTGEKLADLALVDRMSDGSYKMHDIVAAVIRNTVHINPNDEFEYVAKDPCEPFEGFTPRA